LYIVYLYDNFIIAIKGVHESIFITEHFAIPERTKF